MLASTTLCFVGCLEILAGHCMTCWKRKKPNIPKSICYNLKQSRLGPTLKYEIAKTNALKKKMAYLVEERKFSVVNLTPFILSWNLYFEGDVRKLFQLSSSGKVSRYQGIPSVEVALSISFFAPIIYVVGILISWTNRWRYRRQVEGDRQKGFYCWAIIRHYGGLGCKTHHVWSRLFQQKLDLKLSTRIGEFHKPFKTPPRIRGFA